MLEESTPRREEKMRCEWAQRQGNAQGVQGPGGPQSRRPVQEKQQISLKSTELNQAAAQVGRGWMQEWGGGEKASLGQKWSTEE